MLESLPSRCCNPTFVRGTKLKNQQQSVRRGGVALELPPSYPGTCAWVRPFRVLATVEPMIRSVAIVTKRVITLRRIVLVCCLR